MMRVVFLFICAFGLSTQMQAMEWHWLDQMRLAVQQMNYRGEFLTRRGDDSSVYSIVHQHQNGNSIELLRQLDGDMIEVIRNGDKMVCYYPEGSESSIDHAVPAAPFSQVTSLDLETISTNYQALAQGEERVAGFLTKVILLEGDDFRYSQKLWLEKETNLLLQSEITQANGDVLEQFRFTRIEIGVTITEEELIPSLKDQGVRQQTAYRSDTVTPEDSAFYSTLGWFPSGMQLTHSEHRTLSHGFFEQRTYSDGLASFSVFVESMKESHGMRSSLARMGATTAVMTYQNGYSVTIIGEIPVNTAKKVISELLIATPSL